jgi:signal transduction histidine kinase
VEHASEPSAPARAGTDPNTTANGPEEEPLASAVTLHGLWQPVATLRALSLALSQGWSTSDDDERIRLVRSIEDETERLRDVVEDLTTLAAVEGDGYTPALRDESVVELLRDAAETVGELSGRLKVGIGPDAIHAMVCADRGGVLQVLKTFLRTADTSSREDAIVTIRAELGEQEVRFVVSYAGEDLTPPSVFDLGGPRRSGRAGAGASRLGMYLARRLIEAQGGWVLAVSEAGASSLAFGLPIAHGAAA